MTKAPLFSIVVPVFNRASTVFPTLMSVKDQTFPDFECIVVDDGSSDSHLLQAVMHDLSDRRFRYVRRTNGGGGAARNTGIEEAAGEYVAFLDSDDLFLPNKLDVVKSHLPSDPREVIYSRVLVDRGVGRFWARPDRAIRHREPVGEYLFVSNQFIQTTSIVLSREMARKTMFDPQLRKGQDLDFCVRLERDGAHFTMIDEPLAVWQDVSEVGRTSRTAGYDAPLTWLEQSRPLLTRRARLGYRATILAYYMAKAKPFRALLDLSIGLIFARVPPKVILRQTMRAYLPRLTYRRMVNFFVTAMGRAAAPVANQSNRWRPLDGVATP